MALRNAFIILALAFSLMALSFSPASGDSKHDALSCESCHTGDGGHGGVPLPAPDICLQCHPDRKGTGHHPVDVVPSAAIEVPSSLPLSEGKLWCSTCHDPHGTQNVALLRVPAAKLCTSCHTK